MNDENNQPEFKGRDDEKVIPVSDDLMQHLTSDQMQQNPATPKISPEQPTDQPPTSTPPTAPDTTSPTLSPDLSQPAATPNPVAPPANQPLPPTPSPDQSSLNSQVAIAADAPLAAEASTQPEAVSTTGTSAPPTIDTSSTVAGLTPGLTQPNLEQSVPSIPITPDVNQAQTNLSGAQQPPPPETPVDSSTPTSPPDDGLTDEQRKFINGASWGPLIVPYYFIANNSLKWSLIWLIFISICTSITFSALPLIFFSPILVVTILSPLVIIFIAFVAIGIIRGRRVAWKSHYWPDFESYKKFQSKWSFWAKIYAVIFYGPAILGIIASLGLILINPNANSLSNQLSGSNFTDSRIEQANDTGKVSSVSFTANMLEKCFTAEATGLYANCGSITDLEQGNYLDTDNTANAALSVRTYANESEALVYAELKSNLKPCEIGSGPKKYYVYDSGTGEALVYCAATPPQQSIRQ